MKHSTHTSLVPRSTRRIGYAGFTLIELLVVVGIISLLVSVLLPSLTQARELARRVTCASRVRQVGFAVFNYTNENDDFYPLEEHPLRDGEGLWTQKTKIYWGDDRDYMEIPDFLQCPSMADEYPLDKHWKSSYAFNSSLNRLYGPHITYELLHALRTVDVSQPSATMMIMGGMKCQRCVRYDNVTYWIFPHLDTLNVVFADGHVDAVSNTDVPTSFGAPFWRASD